MPHSLIVVESPAKVKTIKKYLGPEFEVKASIGHVKDLPKSKLGIDIEDDFEPTYEIIGEKKKVISELKKSAKNVDDIFLASDPDREGEAIAWHVAGEIGRNKNIYRVLFNDLTKKTVTAAIEKPQELNFNKYESQQTRRILDRLVGYQISPILWKKVQRGLSAGRVQSVAVRIICNREAEIQAFVSEEYWNITALLDGKFPPSFEARLTKIDSKKLKLTNEPQTNKILEELKGASYTVTKVEKKETKRSPTPPFTTSKLQQEASRRLHFTARKTMSVAQRLYEGTTLGKEGPVGLITYMRTDSVRIASEALEGAREYIKKNYGKDFLPAKARLFKSSKSSQDAHEAIRPTSTAYAPQNIKKYLKNDEFRLYQLIWNRFIASQMNPTVFDQTAVDIQAGRCLFHAQGSIIKFPGFSIVYSESREKEDNGTESVNPSYSSGLPKISEGEELTLVSLEPKQNFTQPPARFSEATLVKELEEKGVGRPSTYAAIISTIQNRKYTRLEKGRFHPTELGTLVNGLLVDNFPNIMDVQFTASMENKLDMIEKGTITRHKTLEDFYTSFKSELEKAGAEMKSVKGEETPTDLKCEKCGSPMVIKWGKNGKFLACSNYPDCKNTGNITQDEKGVISKMEEETTNIICDLCGKNMIIKEGRFGRFLGCSGYPECKNTKSIDTGVTCPQEGCGGSLCERRSKKGKTFFGCSNYPNCTYALWDRPVPEKCPLCGHPFLIDKYYRGKGMIKTCPNKECGYRELKAEGL
ncbi:MAG: type I DNA topoisomerase [Thermodesulfobacteriota bacterium]|nr:type I DNA topoisomerase [Thermodesulfobacteriota bacterium]